MFYVIDVTDSCHSSFKPEVYSTDKFTIEQVLTIFTNYSDSVRDDDDFCYTLNRFDMMGRVEKYTDGYYQEM